MTEQPSVIIVVITTAIVVVVAVVLIDTAIVIIAISADSKLAYPLQTDSIPQGTYSCNSVTAAF